MNHIQTGADEAAAKGYQPHDPILDEVAAGKRLGGDDEPIKPRTLQRWRLEGIGPKYLKLGKLVRYRQSALDEYLVSCERSSTSEAA